MGWQIRVAYAGANAAAIELVERSHDSYTLLRAPTVSQPLLVVSEPADWPASREDFEDWARTADVLDSAAVSARASVEFEPYVHAPERKELLGLKWLARHAKTSVILYAMETFGGVPEYEWCWVFESTGLERAFIHADRWAVVERVEHGWFRSKTVTRRVHRKTVWEVTPTSLVEHPGESLNILSEAARYLGIWLPGRYFEPHARNFDWTAHRVARRA